MWLRQIDSRNSCIIVSWSHCSNQKLQLLKEESVISSLLILLLIFGCHFYFAVIRHPGCRIRSGVAVIGILSKYHCKLFKTSVTFIPPYGEMITAEQKWAEYVTKYWNTSFFEGKHRKNILSPHSFGSTNMYELIQFKFILQIIAYF